jgi:hypothetical protein
MMLSSGINPPVEAIRVLSILVLFVTLPSPSRGWASRRFPRICDPSPRGSAWLMAGIRRTPGQRWYKRVAPPNGPRPGGLRRSTGWQVFMLPPVPQRAGPSIRERSRITDPRTKGEGMHVHASHDIAVTHKATAPTGPGAACRLLLPATLRTLAAGSPLTATEALNACLATFLLEILLIFAVLPLRHSLVVMSSFVLPAHSMRVAHIERLYTCGTAEIDDLPGSFMPQVAHTPFLLATFPRFCILQTPPPFRAFPTARLQA